MAQRAFPDGVHQVVPPIANHRHLEDRTEFDRLIGYSLGAFLLLRAEIARPSALPLGLIAPFFSFVAEDGGGGRVRRTQLKYLGRWFARDPCAALDDFYQRAGLHELTARTNLPYEKEALAAGLEILIDGAAPIDWPVNAAGFVGADDTLLDAGQLYELCPQMKVVPGAGHHPAPLMEKLADHWNPVL